jgi:hypothetical protein
LFGKDEVRKQGKGRVELEFEKNGGARRKSFTTEDTEGTEEETVES